MSIKTNILNMILLTDDVNVKSNIISCWIHLSACITDRFDFTVLRRFHNFTGFHRSKIEREIDIWSTVFHVVPCHPISVVLWQSWSRFIPDRKKIVDAYLLKKLIHFPKILLVIPTYFYSKGQYWVPIIRTCIEARSLNSFEKL